jgi:hypothetical protein
MFKNMKRKWMIIFGSAALVLTLGVATVAAQTDTPPDMGAEPGTTMQGERPPEGMMVGPGRPGPRGGPRGGGPDKGAFLAEALGITEEALQSAMETAHQAFLDYLVDQGIITEEEAQSGRRPRLAREDAEALSPELRDQFLAEALGISVEALETAKQAAREAGLAQAVEDGILTEEQVQAMAIMEKVKDYVSREALAAQALGISVEKLAEQPLPDWLEAQGLDREAFHAKLDEAREAAIEQAITDGVITQDEADLLEAAKPAGRPGQPGGPGCGDRPAPGGGRPGGPGGNGGPSDGSAPIGKGPGA